MTGYSIKEYPVLISKTMEVIKLKLEKEDKRIQGATYFHKCRYVVRHHYSVQAIIYQYEDDKFCVHIEDQWVEKNNLDQCKAYVIESIQTFLATVFKVEYEIKFIGNGSN